MSRAWRGGARGRGRRAARSGTSPRRARSAFTTQRSALRSVLCAALPAASRRRPLQARGAAGAAAGAYEATPAIAATLRRRLMSASMRSSPGRPARPRAAQVPACGARSTGRETSVQATTERGAAASPLISTGTRAAGIAAHAAREHARTRRRRGASSPWRCQLAQHALAPEADALERDLRAAVAGVRPGGQAVQPEPLERQRGDQRLRLGVRPAAPPAVPEPRADGGVAVAARELGQAGDADRPVARGGRSRKSSSSPRSRLAGERRRCRPRGCSMLVYGPHEKKRVTAGSAAELEQRARRRRARRVAQRQASGPRTTSGSSDGGRHRPDAIHARGARLSSTTSTATCPRSRRCWPTRGRAAPSAGCSAATTRCSAPGRRRRSRGCARSSPRVWIRGNGERWTADPDEAPDNPVVPGAIAAVPRGARADEVADARRRSRSTALAGRRADLPRLAGLATSARSCPSRPTTRPSCSTASTEPRLIFGHTHLPFRARVDGAASSWSTRARSGMPFDGDPRAAYALVHDDRPRRAPRGSPTTTARPPRGCASRWPGAGWAEMVARRIEQARMDV